MVGDQKAVGEEKSRVGGRRAFVGGDKKTALGARLVPEKTHEPAPELERRLCRVLCVAFFFFFFRRRVVRLRRVTRRVGSRFVPFASLARAARRALGPRRDALVRAAPLRQ